MMDKPHLRLGYAWAGLWFCELHGTITGVGKTPKDAYACWQSLLHCAIVRAA